MTPLEVPNTIDADTNMHVGEPKLRLPASEKACPLSLFSLVHRTTSHGGVCDSTSAWSSWKLELRDACRLWEERNAGDAERGLCMLGEEMRDWKRRSKGRNEGVGLLRPGREATEGRTLLPGEDR
jgi:hypothetical protein